MAPALTALRSDTPFVVLLADATVGSTAGERAWQLYGRCRQHNKGVKRSTEKAAYILAFKGNLMT